MFGDGQLTACKPISESDLASFIVDAVTSKDMINQILPIGGPGDALTPIQQAAILFKYAKKKENTFAVPVSLMDGVIGLFEFLEKFFPNLEVSLALDGPDSIPLCRTLSSLHGLGNTMLQKACWSGIQRSKSTMQT